MSKRKMKNIDALLNGDEPYPGAADNRLSTLLITNHAYEKAFAYARLMDEVAGRSMECGGYLISPNDSDDLVATDVFLARGQNVKSGFFEINARDVRNAGKEIRSMGYRPLGWWHSHGHLKTFFSPLDEAGQMTMLNQIAPSNYIIKMREHDVGDLESHVDGNHIVVHDKKMPGRQYRFEVKNPARVSVMGLQVVDQLRIGFAYGLVVNDQGKRSEPYAEIATRKICSLCTEANDESREVNVGVVDAGEVDLKESKLKAELENRVKFRRRFWGFWVGKGNKNSYSMGSPEFHGPLLPGQKWEDFQADSAGQYGAGFAMAKGGVVGVGRRNPPEQKGRRFVDWLFGRYQ